MADVQGFLVTLTLDTVEITAFCNDVTLSRAKNVMSKPTMDGTGVPIQLTGSLTGTLSMSGQVDTAGQDGLETTWAKDTEAAASDAWNFSLDGATDSVDYVAPVP